MTCKVNLIGLYFLQPTELTMPFTKEQLLETAAQFAGLADHPRYGHLFAACAAGLRAWEARRGFSGKPSTPPGFFWPSLSGMSSGCAKTA